MNAETREIWYTNLMQQVSFSRIQPSIFTTMDHREANPNLAEPYLTLDCGLKANSVAEEARKQAVRKTGGKIGAVMQVLLARKRDTSAIERTSIQDTTEASRWWHKDEANDAARLFAATLNAEYDFWQIQGTFIAA